MGAIIMPCKIEKKFRVLEKITLKISDKAKTTIYRVKRKKIHVTFIIERAEKSTSIIFEIITKKIEFSAEITINK